MANTLMHAAMIKDHALRGGGRSCPCCGTGGTVKETGRQEARQKMRQIEKRQWKKDQDNG
jgi:hypothetical protein